MATALHPFHMAHLPELTDLWVAAWQATMPQIDFEARRDWFVDHIAMLRERGAQLIVAFDDTSSTMQGFVSIEPATGWLDQIAIAPASIGNGAAKALLDAAKAASPERVALDVNLDNPRAIRFYEREGFILGAVSTNPRGLEIVAMHWRPAQA